MRLTIALALSICSTLALATIPPVVQYHTTVTDDNGNTIAVCVVWPKNQADSRYASTTDESVGVVINVPGGTNDGAGNYPNPTYTGFAEWGLVDVSFIFPGGAIAGYSSSGTYDYRGSDSIAALSAVIDYACGGRNDSSGQSIDDAIANHADSDSWSATDVDLENVGISARSNGGNISVITLAVDGSSWNTPPAWIATYESPFGDEYQVGDIGTKGNPLNPTYTLNSCDLTGCGLDYSAVSVDGSIVYLEDPSSATSAWDPGEYVFNAYSDGTTDYYSRSVSDALDAAGITPSGVASASAAATFWDDREVTASYGAYSSYFHAAIGALPNLRTMVVARQVDHVQAAEDHPHVRLAANAWYDAGAPWVRVNPDTAYVEDLSIDALAHYSPAMVCNEGPVNSGGYAIDFSGRTHELSGTGTWPWSWFDDRNQVYVGLIGNTCNTDKVVMPAAICEMADRTHDNDWTSNLSAVLH